MVFTYDEPGYIATPVDNDEFDSIMYRDSDENILQIPIALDYAPSISEVAVFLRASGYNGPADWQRD